MKAALVGLATVGWVSPVLASPSISLTEVGISGCLSREELTARVEEGLGGRRIEADETLRVRIERTHSSGLVARIGWFRGETALGERVIDSQGPDCRELDAALVLVATTLFDEAPHDPEPASPSDVGPSVVAPPEAPPLLPVTDSTPRDAVKSRSDPSVNRETSVLFGGSAALGILSQASLALRVDVRMKLAEQLALWISGQGIPWRPARRVDEAEVDFAVALASAAACWPMRIGERLTLDTCGGFTGGVIASRGTSIRGDSDTLRPLLWPIGAIAVSAPVWSSVLARVHVAGGPALFRHDYFVTDSAGAPQAVRRAGPALWESGLEIGFLLP